MERIKTMQLRLNSHHTHTKKLMDLFVKAIYLGDVRA